ncbi:MAG: gfo/Idh/MocA family oxidoreductase [Pseudonocardiaceae bacterium]|nr:gfo/Idh/MocA family oxidoreductase [Pseudonocardiaceae bacterium]
MTVMHRFALIGAGSMGALHARVLAASERARLVRVVEPDEKTGRAVADRYQTEWRPLLDSLSDVDAIVLASSTESHHKSCLEILRNDKPVLVEKPVCDTLSATEEVIQASESLGVPFMCGLLERYNPAVLTVRALLGTPVHFMARRHGPYAPRIRTGVAWDLLIHDVDIAIQFFGGTEPIRSTADVGFFHPSSAPDAEDTVETVLAFDSGLATASASRLGQRKVRSLVVSELDRLIEIDLIRRDVTIYRHVSHDAVTDDGRGYRQQTVLEIPELITAREPLATQLDRFLDLLEGKVDAAAERASILPAHRVVAQVLEQSRG